MLVQNPVQSPVFAPTPAILPRVRYRRPLLIIAAGFSYSLYMQLPATFSSLTKSQSRSNSTTADKPPCRLSPSIQNLCSHCSQDPPLLENGKLRKWLKVIIKVLLCVLLCTVGKVRMKYRSASHKLKYLMQERSPWAQKLLWEGEVALKNLNRHLKCYSLLAA